MTDDPREDEQPAGPGSEDGPKPPTGRAAVDAAAEHKDVNAAVQASALAYFMGDEPPPARDDVLELEVDFGTKAKPNLQPCIFRTLAAEEFDKCEELAQVKNKAGAVERIDPFVRWSYVFAYACQQPDLGTARATRLERLGTKAAAGDAEAKAEIARIGNDTSGLVREVFRFQPGVLQSVSFEIEKRSRMGDADDRSVVEVEAGKTSS